MKNEPLTLEELSEMDGQPVWVQTVGEHGKWFLVCNPNGVAVNLIDQRGTFHRADTLIQYNTIYRSPPDGDMPDGCTPVETGKVAEHRNLCLKLNKIYRKKNHDYGDSFHETFQAWGPVSAGVRMSDKLSRFTALSKTEAEVDDESVIDTLMDLANYAVMTILELEGNHE